MATNAALRLASQGHPRAGTVLDDERAASMARHPAGRRRAVEADQRAACMTRHPAGRRAALGLEPRAMSAGHRTGATSR